MSRHLQEAPTTFCQKDLKTGLINVICMNTGNVVAVQRSEVDLYRFPDVRKAKMTIQEYDGKKFWVEKGLDLQLHFDDNFRYSELKACLFCNEIVNGRTIIDICDDPKFPDYTVICYWQSKVPDFRHMLAQAKRDSGETHFGKAIKTADEATGKDADRLKVDTHKWAAASRDPDGFGTKTKISGDANAPISFIIDTGIRDRANPEYNIDESLVSRDVKELGEVDGQADAGIQDAGAAADDSSSGDTAEVIDNDAEGS